MARGQCGSIPFSGGNLHSLLLAGLPRIVSLTCSEQSEHDAVCTTSPISAGRATATPRPTVLRLEPRPTPKLAFPADHRARTSHEDKRLRSATLYPTLQKKGFMHRTGIAAMVVCLWLTLGVVASWGQRPASSISDAMANTGGGT